MNWKNFGFLVIFFLLSTQDKLFAQEVDFGCSPDYPPFEFIENGKIVGFEPDLINEISNLTGIKFNLKKMPFDTILGSVTSRKVEMGAAAFNIKESRKENVSFSDEIARSSISILSKKENNFKKLEDLKHKIVTVQTGTLQFNILKEHNKKYNLQIKIVALKDNYLSLQMLKNRKSDAFFVETATAKLFEKKNAKILISNIAIVTEEKYAFIFKKNSPLREKVNEALAKLRKSGKYDEIYKKWFIDYTPNDNKKEALPLQTFYKIANMLIFLLKGFALTLKISLISVILGTTLAIFIAIINYSEISKNLSRLLKFYVSFIRGTPLMVQLSFWFFVFPILTNIKISSEIAGIIVLSLNSSAYVSEIIRGGMNSFDAKQIEASIALNLTKYQMYKDIMFPQVLRNIIPMLINEFISLIKESAILSILGVEEIISKSNMLLVESYDYFTPILLTALIYYTLCVLLEKAGNYFEKKYHY